MKKGVSIMSRIPHVVNKSADKFSSKYTNFTKKVTDERDNCLPSYLCFIFLIWW